MKYAILGFAAIATLLASCGNDDTETVEKEDVVDVFENDMAEIEFQNEAHELVYDMVQEVGNYSELAKKKDVVYTYTYATPDGKTDISTEKYLFEGELSYGVYQRHDRTFPDLKGLIEQGYSGNEFWLKQDGKVLNDSTRLKRVAFNRPTNFYWFTMFQKLLDPGLIYEYVGEEMVDKKIYDVVKITFEPQGDKVTDIYQLYIHKTTHLVDQFLFTVADFGKMETPLLMQLEYEIVDGITIPTTRKYKQSTWDAEVDDKPWINVTWRDIKFNNGLTKEDFSKNVDAIGAQERLERKID